MDCPKMMGSNMKAQLGLKSNIAIIAFVAFKGLIFQSSLR